MSIDPLVSLEKNKKSQKPLYIAGGITCSLAVAYLLFTSGKSDSQVLQAVEEFQFPKIEAKKEKYPIKETCTSSFDRIWEDNLGNYLQSPKFRKSLGAAGKYVDKSFPADHTSLYWSDQEYGASGQARRLYSNAEVNPGIKWFRPSDIDKDPSLWGSTGISVKTSKQGNLGDCWFLSSAIALAENPYRVQNIFTQSEYPSTGAFETFFYLRGDRVSVTIDDQFPMFRTYYGWNYLNNSPSPTGAWWLVMLEKAYAKLNVNYANLNDGGPNEALKALTGMPATGYTVKERSLSYIWETVTDGQKNNYPMVACTGGDPAYNVVADHCLTVLGALELKNSKNEVEYKLIKMRNPWGIYKYDGPFSENSDLWTPEFKKQADYQGATDGIFYTPVQDWRNEFTFLHWAHYKDTWLIHSIQGDHADFTSSKEASQWLQFSNPVHQDVIIECDQYNDRLFPFNAEPQCRSEYAPQRYDFYIYDNTNPEDPTIQDNKTLHESANCNGNAVHLKNLAKGSYDISVWNAGSDKGRATWQIRTFATEERVLVEKRKDPKVYKKQEAFMY